MQLCKGNEEIQTQHSSGAPGAASLRPPPAARRPPAWKTEVVWAAGRGPVCQGSDNEAELRPQLRLGVCVGGVSPQLDRVLRSREPHPGVLKQGGTPGKQVTQGMLTPLLPTQTQEDAPVT